MEGGYGTAFEYFVAEVINSFPDDSHSVLSSFIEDSGEDPLNVDRFKHAWSKAFIQSRVFGQDRDIDVAKLSQYVREGIQMHNFQIGFNQPAKGSKATGAVMSTGSSSLASSTLSELDKLDRAKEALMHITYFHYDKPIMFDESVSLRKLHNRRALRGMKISWSGNRFPESSKFCPLDLSRFGRAECIFGIGQPKHDICALKTMSFVGIKISSDRPLAQEAAWGIYSDLVTFSAAQDGALLPLAVAASREGGNTSSLPYCLFIFEMPSATALESMVGGGGLAIGLRKYPSLLLTWASQLGKAYAAIRSKNAGTLMQARPSRRNLFVRSDGRLILGHIAPFCHLNAKRSSSVSQACAVFTEFTIDLLKSILCLSRTEYIYVASAPSGRTHGVEREGIGISSAKDDRSSSSNASKKIYITVGSKLILLLQNIPSRYTRVNIKESKNLPATSGPNTPPWNTEQTKEALDMDSIISTVHVSVLAKSAKEHSQLQLYASVISITELNMENDYQISMEESLGGVKLRRHKSTSSLGLEIIGVAAGSATIMIEFPRLFSPVDYVYDLSPIFVKICVIPRVVVNSVAVAELIGLLESSPYLVFRSKCMGGNASNSIEKEYLDPLDGGEKYQESSSLESQWSAVRLSAKEYDFNSDCSYEEGSVHHNDVEETTVLSSGPSIITKNNFNFKEEALSSREKRYSRYGSRDDYRDVTSNMAWK